MPPTPPPAEPAGSTATASGATGSAADTPTVVRRRDYRPLPWKVAALELVFDLHEDHALVTATASYELAPGQAGGAPPLVLDGEDLELVEIALDGTPLDADDYILTPERMTLDPVRLAGGDEFSLRVVTRLRPQDNRSMEGLYRSGGLFCTQMEAEGFRKVTYFPDRPDALTVWTTTLEADATRYPVLLGNGPRTAYAPLPGGRHRATFVDPVPKPSYLFALVAGDLDKVEGSFTTMSGRDVRLCVWTERGLSARGRHALDSLIAAMAWDERTYGREYDLPEFHIVAVSDFNMGAMENKGLNLFNSNAVLADAATRTDADFLRIEGIVAHEYFHNWSGNRVTCRDWFQLSLKEGFTVFRDQTFSEDTGGAAVQRIQDVRNLREAQFPEDAGPQAHPVRPDEYIAIDNFYTRTVYEKGAEVIRMQRALLGPDAFRRGTDLYFERHDGQAVTCDDFVAALQDASGVDLEAFKACWYAEAGTPRLKTTGRWDAAAGTYTLAVEQSCPPTPGRPTKPPFVIPLALGLVGPDGRDLPLVLQGESASASPAADADGAVTRVLTLDAPRHEFTFTGLKGAGGAALSEAPVPSLLRGFSAPVVLQSDLDDDDLARLAAHDADAFNRWEAFQTLAMRELLRLTHAAQAGGEVSVGGPFARVFEALLEGAADGSVAPLFAAETLELPSERTLNDRLAVPAAAARRRPAATPDRPLRAAARRHRRGRHRRRVRPRGGGPPGPGGRGPVVAGGLGRGAGPRLRRGAVRGRGQHDRRAGGPRRPGGQRRPPARAGPGRLPRQVGRRAAGARQVVRLPGGRAPPVGARRADRPAGRPGLQPRQPQQGARGLPHPGRDAHPLPPQGRQGLRAAGRRAGPPRRTQPDPGRAPVRGLRRLAAHGPGPPGPHARPHGPAAAAAGLLAQPLRDAEQGPLVNGS